VSEAGPGGGRWHRGPVGRGWQAPGRGGRRRRAASGDGRAWIAVEGGGTGRWRRVKSEGGDTRW
jgi:hypothetical protein